MAQPGPAVPGAGSAPPGRSVWYLAVLVGLTVAVIALVVLGTMIGWQVLQAAAEDSRRDLVLQTARQGALDLTNIDYRTADDDVHRLLDGATPGLATGFGVGSPQFVEMVKQTRLISTGQVTSAGIERLDQHSARVLVAVKAVVRDGGDPQGAPRNYRMGVELVQQGDRWLVSKVEFVL